MSQGHRLLKSMNGGSSWAELDLPSQGPYSIALDPLEPDTIYVVNAWYYTHQDVSLYKSFDGGDIWWVAISDFPRAVLALTVHPSQVSSLFAGLEDYGVYRSMNGGGSWVESNEGMQSLAPIAALATGALTDTVLASSGDERGGLFRTSNSGATWTAVISDTLVYAIAADPLTPTTLYAGAEDDLYISTDGGNRWHPTFYDTHWDFLEIAFDPANPETVFVVGQDDAYYPGEGFLSKRIGAWMWTTTRFTNTAKLNAIAIHPHDPAAMYLGGAGKYPKSGVIFRSQDSGTSWTQVFTTSFGWGVSSVVIDPRNPETIYAGVEEYEGVYKSTDGGDTWLAQNGSLPINVEGPNDVHALVIDAFGTVYRGTDTGAYYTADGGETWTALDDGLPNERINALAVDEHYLLAGAHKGGVWRYLIAKLSHKVYLPLVFKSS
jgi:photosystem II stability/assembly factor-like uncharacterized protein